MVGDFGFLYVGNNEVSGIKLMNSIIFFPGLVWLLCSSGCNSYNNNIILIITERQSERESRCCWLSNYYNVGNKRCDCVQIVRKRERKNWERQLRKAPFSLDANSGLKSQAFRFR